MPNRLNAPGNRLCCPPRSSLVSAWRAARGTVAWGERPLPWVNRRGYAWVRPWAALSTSTSSWSRWLATGDPSDPEPWRPGPDRGRSPGEVLNGVAVPNASGAPLPTRHPARGW